MKLSLQLLLLWILLYFLGLNIQINSVYAQNSYRCSLNPPKWWENLLSKIKKETRLSCPQTTTVATANPTQTINQKRGANLGFIPKEIKSNVLYPLSPYPATIIKCHPDDEKCKQPSIELGFLTKPTMNDYKLILRSKDGIVGEIFIPKKEIASIPIDDRLSKLLLPGKTYSFTIIGKIETATELTSFTFSILSEENTRELIQEIEGIKNLEEIKKSSEPEIAKKIAEAAYYREKGLISYSIEQVEKAKNEPSQEYHTLILKALGDSYFEMGIFSKAKENYEEALRVLENLPTLQNKSEIEAEIKSNLGEVYLYEDQSSDNKNNLTQKLDKSIQSFEKAQYFYCKLSKEYNYCQTLTDKIESLNLLKQQTQTQTQP